MVMIRLEDYGIIGDKQLHEAYLQAHLDDWQIEGCASVSRLNLEGFRFIRAGLDVMIGRKSYFPNRDFAPEMKTLLTRPKR